MAAGLGYKEFATGDVLTAADANGYLASQVVMVFASAAARTSAIASPQEGMISYLKDTDVTQYYSGSAWAAIDAASGGMTLLSTTSLSGSSVTISSINQTYTDLMIVITGMSSSSNYAPHFQYNGVTSGYMGATAANASSSLGTSNPQNDLNLAVFDIWAASNANSLVTIYIKNYAGTGYHNAELYGAYFTNTSLLRTYMGMGGNANTSAVSSVTFFPDAGSFNAGSIKIYGVK